MSGSRSDAQVVDGLRLELRLQADRRMWRRSSTLWGLFGVKKRTTARADLIRQLFMQNGIELETVGEFGQEPLTSSVWLTLTDAEPWPELAWFETMKAREFESENEVEYFFVLPMLDRLSYREDDISVQHPLDHYRGTTKTRLRADIAVFNGNGRQSPLLIVEAKHKLLLDRDAIEQARSYALALHAHAYLVTNGEEARSFRTAVADVDPTLTFHRSRLSEQWSDIVRHLSRESLVLQT